jgi:hypothetical protein
MSTFLRALATVATAAALVAPVHIQGPSMRDELLRVDPLPVSMDQTLALVTNRSAGVAGGRAEAGGTSDSATVEVTIGLVVFARTDGLPSTVLPGHAYRATFTFYVSTQLNNAHATVTAAGATVRQCSGVPVAAGPDRLGCTITPTVNGQNIDISLTVDTPAGAGDQAAYRHIS